MKTFIAWLYTPLHQKVLSPNNPADVPLNIAEMRGGFHRKTEQLIKWLLI
jgi:hypothetical protein